MGNWNINIQGIGPHHSDEDWSVEQITAKFVAELVKNGHTVEKADVTCGSKIQVK